MDSIVEKIENDAAGELEAGTVDFFGRLGLEAAKSETGGYGVVSEVMVWLRNPANSDIMVMAMRITAIRKINDSLDIIVSTKRRLTPRKMGRETDLLLKSRIDSALSFIALYAEPCILFIA